MNNLACILPSAIAFIGLVVAIFKLVDDAKRSRFQSGVSIVLKFSEQFDSEEMQGSRKTAASAIKLHKNSKQPADMKAVDDVLDFFETVAYLAKKDGIDKEFAWHTFYYWLHRYFLLCQGYIFAIQEKDKARWEDLCWLHTELNAIEELRGGKNNDLKVGDYRLTEFIEEELS